MALVAVLTTKQQEALNEGFLSWREKDNRVKEYLGDYEFDDRIRYPGNSNDTNKKKYCRLYANLDACRWKSDFRNKYCRDECKEGKSMNCYYGPKHSKWFPRSKCSHKGMDHRGRIDECKTQLAEGDVYARKHTNLHPKHKNSLYHALTRTGGLGELSDDCTLSPH